MSLMNRTQRITSDWLLQSGLVGDELVLEALLRRGFLAFRDDQGVWLGTGSHPEDLHVLSLAVGLAVESISGYPDRMARVNWQSSGMTAIDVAIRIVALPENRGFIGIGDMPFMPFRRWGHTWVAYRNMVWGNMVATCPTRLMHERPLGYIALDLGVALLVKVLPLARVATNAWSCDGHGRGPATIRFRFNWDASWGKTVFDVLAGSTPDSTWKWNRDLQVATQGEYGDAQVLGMLNDIQHFSRRLLDQSTIDRIGRARARTLAACGKSTPIAERFAQEARHQLAEEFPTGIRLKVSNQDRE